MSEMSCAYSGDREAALMDYLYDEMTADARAQFDTHLAACARCRVELNSFGRVRRQLGEWQPPVLSVGSWQSAESVGSRQLQSPAASPQSPALSPQPPAPSPQAWRSMPAWAQAAAAMLFLGVSAGIANLDVKYDANGLSVRTGWSKPANTANVTNAANSANLTNPANASPWRADFAALESSLRSEIQAASHTSQRPVVAPSASDGELFRRVKALVDDSERRQQNELALRIADVLRDVNTRRDGDLRRIQANFDGFGQIQKSTGVEMMKNRQMLDFYVQRVSQRP